MKKLLLLILLMAVSLVSNASLWVETFGPDDAAKAFYAGQLDAAAT